MRRPPAGARPAIGTIDELLEVLARGARHDDGEPVDLLAHGLQCAALLAAREPDDLELQVAGLVHDVGTVLEPGRPATHAATGATAIATLLGERVAALVGAHDAAKRYLVVADPDYRARLSPVSVATLAAQGGPLDDRDRVAFEATADFDALLALRRADDAAKVPEVKVPALDVWRPVLALLTRR